MNHPSKSVLNYKKITSFQHDTHGGATCSLSVCLRDTYLFSITLTYSSKEVLLMNGHPNLDLYPPWPTYWALWALSPVSDRAEKAAKIPCSRRNKLCSATQPVRHLSDHSYRLVAFCPVFPRPATFLAFEDYCLELAQNDANSQMSSLGGRRLPYLEMHHFWRLQTSPKKYKGRVSSWKLHSLTEVHFSRQNVVLFPTTSPQALLTDFQLLSSHGLRLIAQVSIEFTLQPVKHKCKVKF